MGTISIPDWNGDEIACAHSKGGVRVVAHPYDNLIRTGCRPWPPAEIVQKLYKSRHEGAFSDEDKKVLSKGLGYYCDLQSLHSEDAITWSVFGTAAGAPQPNLRAWLRDLCGILDLPTVQPDDAQIDLWRRVPHPDTLVSGGPEIDVSIFTTNTVILVEAKWKSSVARGQGKNRDKDQIQLRGEFFKKYGARIFPNQPNLIVAGIGLSSEGFTDTTPEGITFTSATWQQVCSLASHPHAKEVRQYYEWKKKNTKMDQERVGTAR
ncbi:MAG TPA: hypothetical protein VM118_11230 [Acidobacteriota bacterium]|nr:hypothetical protein [Acidobacteriota bacterium]